MKTNHLVPICALFGLLAFAALGALSMSTGVVAAQGPDPTPVSGAASQSPESFVPNSENRAITAAPEQPDAAAVTTNYQHVSGSAFVSLYDTAQTVYSGSGCKYMTGIGLYANHSIILPYNSTVTQLRLYYKDTSASNGTLWLAQYDDGLSYTYLITLTTSGASGWGTATATANIPLDYVNYSYTVLWSPAGVVDGTMQLCGFRVGYIPPSIFGTALPLITK